MLNYNRYRHTGAVRDSSLALKGFSSEPKCQSTWSFNAVFDLFSFLLFLHNKLTLHLFTKRRKYVTIYSTTSITFKREL